MNKLFAAISVLAFFVIVVMMFMFSPTEVGALGIFVFFVLCYAFFLGLADKVKKNGIAGIEKKSYKYGLVLAVAPELLIILNTGGTIGVMQIIAIVVAEFLLWFIVSHLHV